MPLGVAKLGARFNFNGRIHDVFYVLRAWKKAVSDNLCFAVLFQSYLQLDALPARVVQDSHAQVNRVFDSRIPRDCDLSRQAVGFSFAPDCYTGDFSLADKIESGRHYMGDAAIGEHCAVRTHPL
jgi:hypothetical protein